MRNPLILLPTLALLAACQPDQKPVPDNCGASGMQGLIGTPVAAAAFPSGGTARIYQEGAPLTKDYRLDRLNVEYDKAGTIIRIWCG